LITSDDLQDSEEKEQKTAEKGLFDELSLSDSEMQLQLEQEAILELNTQTKWENTDSYYSEYMRERQAERLESLPLLIPQEEKLLYNTRKKQQSQQVSLQRRRSLQHRYSCKHLQPVRLHEVSQLQPGGRIQRRDVPDLETTAYCLSHKEELLRFFCSTCQLPICSECVK